MSIALEQLKASFSSIAALYDSIRPTYPDQVAERVLADLPDPRTLHILEVGCGSGQATELFSRADARIVATDLSPELIALARERLANFPNVKFRVSPFEA